VNTAAAQTCGFYGMCTLNTINIIVLDRGIYNAYSSLAYLRISEMTNFLSRLKSEVWEVSFLHGMLASFYMGDYCMVHLHNITEASVELLNITSILGVLCNLRYDILG